MDSNSKVNNTKNRIRSELKSHCKTETEIVSSAEGCQMTSGQLQRGWRAGELKGLEEGSYRIEGEGKSNTEGVGHRLRVRAKSFDLCAAINFLRIFIP